MTVENGPAGAHPSTAALSRADVVHVARLARLDLSEDELELFTGQLASVLDYAADVAALDLTGVRPTAHPLPVVNVLRDDVVAPSPRARHRAGHGAFGGGRPLQRAAHRRRGAVSADGRSARRTAADIASAVAAARNRPQRCSTRTSPSSSPREPDLHAFVSVLGDEARERAAAIDRSVAAGEPVGRSLGCRWP